MNNRDLWEEEMEDMIRKTGEGLLVPERLQPENIRKELLKRKGVIRGKRKKQIWRWCAAAASVCLIGSCGVAWTLLGERTAKTPCHDTSVAEKGRGDTVESETDQSENLAYAGDYQEVYRTIKKIENRTARIYKQKGIVQADSVSDAETSDNYMENVVRDAVGSQQAEAVSSKSHSETNVSVEGILEADQVCTDGDYIYRLRERVDGKVFLEIIKAEGGSMKLTGKYSCGDKSSTQEFFLAGEQLILLSTVEKVGKLNTEITFLDIRNPEKPVKTGKLTQTGSYSQARLQDGYLYTVSGNRAYYEKESINGEVQQDEESLIPCLNESPIPASRIYLPEDCDDTAFTTITSVRLTDTGDFADSRSILASAEYLHMTENNIYFLTNRWMDARKKGKVTTKTQITKFSYQKGKFSGKATKVIKGSVKDTFAINEYQGNLRVISSISYLRGKDDNAVYVLDENLKIIGSLEHLAKEERVYSARFQGDIGYFVTYRETDPLFSVDFSDPHNPKILGKLKIPGFSEYLHFYNDHLLFGIGLEVSKDGEEEAVKLSMFDISDPTDVREIHKTLLKNISYSQALYKYKSVLIDTERNIIGFDGETWTDSNDLLYFVYSYDEEKGFVQKMKQKLSDRFQVVRGLYIDDVIYLADLFSTSLEAYDFKTGKCIGVYQKK